MFRRQIVPSLALACCAMNLNAQQSSPAEKFVDSVGVNIHMHYNDTAYADQAKVIAALKQLGVRHVRDGMVDSTYEPYFEGLRTLGREGIHALLIVDPKAKADFMQSFPAKVPGVVEGVEAPNELDAGDPDWVEKDRASEEAMRSAFQGTSIYTVGPSMTKGESFAQLGSVACICKFGNLHNYWAGRPPGTTGWGDDGYGSYPWNLKHARAAFGSKPIFSTETGYFNDTAKNDGLPEDVAGKYTVRLLLEQFLHGIQRTYLYELVDVEIPSRDIHDRFGLLRSDFSPRPSFTGVSSLMGLLREDDLKATGAASAWQLSSAPTSVHHLALTKRNGETVLLLWQEVSGYDVQTKKYVAVSPVTVQLRSSASDTAKVSHFAADGTLQVEQVQHAGGQLSLPIDDLVTAVILPPASGSKR